MRGACSSVASLSAGLSPLPPCHGKIFKSEAPLFIAKACYLFIQDITARAWACADHGRRKGVQVCPHPHLLY
jgi:hypothetical protein